MCLRQVSGAMPAFSSAECRLPTFSCRERCSIDREATTMTAAHDRRRELDVPPAIRPAAPCCRAACRGSVSSPVFVARAAYEVVRSNKGAASEHGAVVGSMSTARPASSNRTVAGSAGDRGRCSYAGRPRLGKPAAGPACGRTPPGGRRLPEPDPSIPCVGLILFPALPADLLAPAVFL